MPALLSLLLAVTAAAPSRLLVEYPSSSRRAGTDGHVKHISGFVADMGTHDAEASARLFLDRYAEEFGVDSTQLVLLGEPASGDGGAVKFRRAIQGMPLFGGDITVGVDEKRRVLLVNSAAAAGEISGSHLIGETAAHQAALAAMSMDLPGADEGFIVKGYRTILGKTRAVYRVDFTASHPSGDWRSYVDGETGAVLLRQNLRDYASGAGSVYQVSPSQSLTGMCPTNASGFYTACQSPVAVTLLNLNDATHLSGSQTATYNCNGGNEPASRANLLNGCTSIAALAGGGFQFAVDNTQVSLHDDFAGEMAYFHLDKHVTFFKLLDPTLPPVDTSDPGHPLAIRGSMPGLVNLLDNGSALENAFFSGVLDAMAFGQGSQQDYAYDATVMYHEYTHGVVFAWGGYETDLGSSGAFEESGGLNEGTADSMAVSETGNSLIGAFLGPSFGSPYLRNLNDPDATKSCHGNGSSIKQQGGTSINGFDGEVHDDGEIWGGFYWEVFAGLAGTGFKACNGSCEAGPALMYKTIQLAGGAQPDFATYWQTFKTAATTVFPTQPSVNAYADCVAKRRGFDKCDRTVPLYAGEIKAQFFRHRYSPFQVALQLTGAATFVVCDNAGLSSTIYARKGAPVALSNIDQDTGNATITADGAGVPFTASCSGTPAAFNIGGSQGAGTYYLLIDSPNADFGQTPGEDAYFYGAFAVNRTTTGFAARPAATTPATCTPPAPFAVTAVATVAPRAGITLASTGGTGTGLTWSIATNHSGGSIVTSTGVYTAGTTPNTSDTISAADSLGDSATQTVAVGPGVTVSPATASLSPGGTQLFTATGGSGTFTWSLATNASGGTIASNGSYAAGAISGVDTIKALDSVGNSATASVTVTAASGAGGGGGSTGGGGGNTDGGSGGGGCNTEGTGVPWFAVFGLTIALLRARRRS